MKIDGWKLEDKKKHFRAIRLTYVQGQLAVSFKDLEQPKILKDPTPTFKKPVANTMLRTIVK